MSQIVGFVVALRADCRQPARILHFAERGEDFQPGHGSLSQPGFAAAIRVGEAVAQLHMIGQCMQRSQGGCGVVPGHGELRRIEVDAERAGLNGGQHAQQFAGIFATRSDRQHDARMIGVARQISQDFVEDLGFAARFLCWQSADPKRQHFGGEREGPVHGLFDGGNPAIEFVIVRQRPPQRKGGSCDPQTEFVQQMPQIPPPRFRQGFGT